MFVKLCKRLVLNAGMRKAIISFEYLRDSRRYTGFSSLVESSSDRLSGARLESQLTRDYHRVEKGLALPAPKRPFGESSFLDRMNSLIPVAQTSDRQEPYIAAAVTARDALVLWNATGVIDEEVAPVPPPYAPDSGEMEAFFTSRRSVRHFKSTAVDLASVYEAVRLASYSPSVCNRQPWKVRIFEGDDVARLLRHQSGNRGFGDNVPLLALISVELGYFVGRRERNQAWIDGGIFSSSFVWALHSLGLSSCMLNLSITNKVADRLREDANMPASEVPIMMVAIGHGADGHRVARSVRRGTDQIILRRTD
ncbi:nitroreductase family protein [Mycolicibacterium vaccae]|uniref:nitroreductase family protein n=1 Tax=Mycolicibacterium vaccae TaxID=1810 RepID=UPI003D03B068